MNDIATLRLVHVLGAVLLLGNVIVTGLWAAALWRERDQIPFRQVARVILWADLVFTVLGGTLLTVSGILLVIAGHPEWRTTPWIRHGATALAAATAVWLVILLPDQWRMLRWREDAPRYHAVYRRWSVVGWGTTVLLLYGLWAMVTKS